MDTWIVQLEATSTEHTGPIDRGSVAHLLGALGAHPVGLHTPGRCLVQLRIASDSPAEALGAALARWEEAFQALGRPPWRIVRTDVLAPDELEREFEDEDLQATFGTVRVPEEGDGVADELLRRAFSDALTNLANEEAFRAHVHAALARSRRLGTTAAVVCIDLGTVPTVDDRSGATPNDDLLVTVARNLRTNLRASDTLARVGHDRFAVVTQSSSSDSAVVLAERLLDAVHVRALIDGEVVVPRAQAGVALSEPTDTAERLYEKARAALTLATRTPEARCKVWGAPTSPPGAVRLPPC